jgi:hypothetical protein
MWYYRSIFSTFWLKLILLKAGPGWNWVILRKVGIAWQRCLISSVWLLNPNKTIPVNCSELFAIDSYSYTIYICIYIYLAIDSYSHTHIYIYPSSCWISHIISHCIFIFGGWIPQVTLDPTALMNGTLRNNTKNKVQRSFVDTLHWHSW